MGRIEDWERQVDGYCVSETLEFWTVWLKEIVQTWI